MSSRRTLYDWARVRKGLERVMVFNFFFNDQGKISE